MSPVYRAESKILIEREATQEKALLFRMNLPLGLEGFDWLRSETEIIRSYPVVARVIKDLGLDRDAEQKEPLDETEQALRFEQGVKRFRKKFVVKRAANSNVIEVSYESKEAEMAVAVVNKVLETYQRYRSEIYNESESYRFFEEQMRITDEKLRDLEERLAVFKNEEEILSPEFQGKILLTKLAEYEKSLTGTNTKIISKKAKLSVIVEQLEKGEEFTIPSTEVSNSLSNEKYITKLKGELLDMKIQRNLLLQKFNPTYEDIVDLEKQIAATQEIIRNEVQQIIHQEQTELRALEAEKAALQEAIDQINRDIKSFAQKEYEFIQLNRGIDDNQEVYSMLLKQREEARISLSKLEKGVKVKIISPAVVPQNPIKPRKKLNLALSIMLGLICGLGLAYFREYYANPVKPEQAEDLSSIAVEEGVSNS
jgi:uncharacterized protein involved in exopolysaccharide biosynthesis